MWEIVAYYKDNMTRTSFQRTKTRAEALELMKYLNTHLSRDVQWLANNDFSIMIQLDCVACFKVEKGKKDHWDAPVIMER